MLKKLGVLGLVFSLVVLFAACGEKTEEASRESYKIGALKGPTAMGLVKLMEDSSQGSKTSNDYSFELFGSADEITPKLIQGELDMACLPANLASVLYGKTEGKISVLGINTLGVLYIVDVGEDINSLSDLTGKTIVAAGRGSTPEYALRHLLVQSGIDPDVDVNIDWKSEHAECVAALLSGAAATAMLPQPFVTSAKEKVEGLDISIDLNKEWESLNDKTGMITGVIVARKDIIEKNPKAIEAFLEEYKDSVDFTNSNINEAAKLIGSYEIIDENVAKEAIPYCNITCITKEELKEKLSYYLKVLFDANPASVGGSLPGDDFYFN